MRFQGFYLSDVFINVTLALSSSFNTGGTSSGRVRLAAFMKGHTDMLPILRASKQTYTPTAFEFESLIVAGASCDDVRALLVS